MRHKRAGSLDRTSNEAEDENLIMRKVRLWSKLVV